MIIWLLKATSPSVLSGRHIAKSLEDFSNITVITGELLFPFSNLH